MLKLTNIRKSYKTYDFTQVALDDVSLSFRDNEFAAILGTSGSGKTTLLNIVGGLDRYDSGDLEIDGISTKKYKSSDWDTYRNNRIGFVFQSYNLIPHQTVLANVELALTLSGVSRAERKERAIKALDEVGLKDHIRKRPSQLSGGQMQRVAIARALINDPEIVLADEPTGALDSQTSIQVMDLLTKIAKDRLVIMVTHNPDLADKYANRIIELKDGKVIGDTNPFDTDEVKISEKKHGKVGMSFFTAISLSLSNLMTKKGRTFVTALAGSIGIIGIAAILALASGINAYIGNIEEETMSNYPLTIQSSGIDITSFITDADNFGPSGSKEEEQKGDVGVRNVFESMFNYQNKNDLKSLKAYIQQNQNSLEPYIKNIQYKYDITPQIYLKNVDYNISQVSPDAILGSYGIGNSSGMNAFMGGGSAGMNNFHELPGKNDMFEYQYDIKSGRWPSAYDEAVVVLMGDGSISDFVLYSLGIKDRSELHGMLDTFVNNPGKSLTIDNSNLDIKYDDLLNSELSVIDAANKYVYDENYGVWMDKSDNESHMKTVIEDGVQLKIVGVVQADSDATATMLSSGIYYTPELVQHLLTQASDHDIVQEQLDNPSVNVFTGETFISENVKDDKASFNFSDLFTIDETAMRNAFKFDTSKLNVKVPDLSIDVNALKLPEFDIAGMNKEIASQVEIPVDQLNAIFTSTLDAFMKEQAQAGITDPLQMAQNLNEYLSRPAVQKALAEQLQASVNPSQISQQVTEVIQKYISTALRGTMNELMTTVQSQIQSQLQSTLKQLPQQIQSAISIDQAAFMQAFKLKINEEDILDLLTALMNPKVSTVESNLKKLGYADINTPSQIGLYPKDFTTKENVIEFLNSYNTQMENSGNKEQIVKYTDLVGTLMSSVTDIVDTISYALIAFVAISLVVSSIMIGVITYVSVLERKKEIGILRAIGASKRDIRRVFNAETMIIGFIAGGIGVGVTYLISIVANIAVYNEFGIANIAQLPTQAAGILVAISMALAFISGLFPSSAAARKDPVEALRSE
ncbi:ABC transporter ATP-binding protein/permease [Erysipelothrix sp. HDW6A]|uniref:ABC transporter ATP-binding protein/permease n=1 Tax=Erysipelothrix sp. HDW6A TaxID=2714928 RepID=UPI0014082728|nr:ABC transporter ATP-binding protein/permease [Erysipelothrix sp. HDW6A]QIK57912.1 ABC transporter ATP-binding protein/permease [Erysipelothrix sp. HDW6A]